MGGDERSDQLAKDFQSDTAHQINRVLAVYRPLLRRVVNARYGKKLRRRLDASDIVQEGLLKGYRYRKKFSGTTDAELQAWFQKIMIRVLLDAERFHTREKRNIHQEADNSRLPSIAAPHSSAEEITPVQRALNELPENYQLTLRWRGEGTSFREIGVRLNRSEDAARMLWGRAFKRIMKLVPRG